jgi:hypothetical protein
MDKDAICYGCEQYDKIKGCLFFRHTVQYCSELTGCNYGAIVVSERIEQKAW